MKKISTLLSMLILFAGIANAQSIYLKTYTSLTGSTNNIHSVIAIPGGGYMLGGNTIQMPGVGMMLAKTDAEGNIEWSKGYGGNFGRIGYKTIGTQDGGFAMVGYYTLNNAPLTRYLHIVKTDAAGVMLWHKEFEVGAAANLVQIANEIVELSDGSLIVAGSSGTQNYASLIKLSANGTLIWANHHRNAALSTYINKLIVLGNGDLIVTGKTNSLLYVARLDGLGNQVWAKTYVAAGTEGINLIPTSDGNYLVMGIVGTGMSLTKMDAAGTVIWSQRYNTTSTTVPFALRELSNGDIYVTGHYSTNDFIFKVNSTGVYLTGKNFNNVASGANGGFVTARSNDGANVIPTCNSILKFRDNFTTCSGSTFFITPTVLTPIGSNITLSYNTYLNSMNLPNFEAAIHVNVASNCGGKCTAIDNLTASFSSNFNDICKGITVTFTNSSSGANSAAWYENGILFSTATSPTRTFTSAGTFTIKLIVGSASGCTDTATTVINVSNFGNTGNVIQTLNKAFTNLAQIDYISPTSDRGFIISAIETSMANVIFIKTDSIGTIQWTQRFNRVYGYIVKQTLDGGYIGVSQTSAQSHLFVVKLNSAGVYQWHNDYRLVSFATNQYVATDMLENSDGSVVIVGNKVEGANRHAFVLKLDPTGNVLWEKNYRDLSVTNTYATAVIKSISNNILICGYANNTYLLELDVNNGNVIWNKTIGMGSCADVIKTADGNYLLAGEVPSSLGGYATGLVKVDPQGIVQWCRMLEYSATNFRPYSICEAPGGRILGMSGYGGGWSVGVFATDAFGFAYGGQDPGVVYNQGITKIIPTADGGFIEGYENNIFKWSAAPYPKVCFNGNGAPNVRNTFVYTAPVAQTLTFGSYSLIDAQPLTNSVTAHTASGCSNVGCTTQASFTAPIQACTGQLINLSNTSVGGVSYKWKENNVQFSTNTNETRTYGSPGTYAIKLVTTGTGTCKDSITINIVVSTGVTANAGSDVSITCGNNTTLSASGGTTYLWSPSTGLSNPSISNPVASPTITTTYTCTVGNGGPCTATDAVLITVAGGPTVNVSGPVSICNGGSTTITASGATTYVWSPATGLSSTTVSNPLASPTVTTTYTVTGTTGGCSGTNTVTVTVNTSPTVTASATSNTICEGSSTTLNSSGANSYVWNPGNLSGSSVSVSPTTTTTYTVTGTAVNGCTNTNTTTITVNTLPNVTATATSNTICNGSSTTLNSSGANTYVWNPGSLTGSSVSVSPTTTTTYTVTGTAVSGCTNTNTTTITVNPLPNVTGSATSNTICNGGSTTLNSSGANTYVWNPGSLSGSSVSVSPTTTTTYTVTGTAVSGCTNSNTTTITVNPLPNVTASATSNTICNGSSTTLNSSGANTYVWNPGNLSGSSVSVSPTTTTTFTVTGTAASGCTNTNTTTITVNPLPNVTASATSNTICNGSSTTLNSSGANTYVWNPGSLSGSSVSVSPTTTTTYTVTGTAASGCTNTNTVTITVNALPTVTASATSNTICNGSATTLNSSGANTYVWNPGNLSGSSVSVSPTTTTTYTVTGTAASGCTNTNTTTITVNPLPTVSASATSNTICNGSSTTLNSSGANTYVWNPGNLSGSSVSVSPTTTTTYTVTGTAVGGCTNTNTTTITVNPLPTVTASATSNTICNGSSTTLNSSGANTYIWNPGNLSGSSVSVSPTTTTTYTVTGTAATGCTNTNTTTITVNPLPTVSASATNNTLCNGGSTTLNSSGANTYVWSPGNLSGSSVSVSPTTTTTYTVTGTDGNGCTNTNTVTINVGTLPTVIASTSSGTICSGDTTTLNSSGANTYVWNPGNLNGSSVSVSPGTTTTYTVTGTDANGCSNTSSVSITVNPLPNVTYIQNPNSVCINTPPFTLTVGSPANGTYSGTAVTGNTFDPSVSGTGTFTITYTYTDVNGCTNFAASQINVGLCIGVDQMGTGNLQFTLFPNPFNDQVTIQCENLSGQTNVCIFDELGQLLKCIQLSNNTTEIDTQDLASGIYMFQLITTDQVITKKLVKTN